MKRFAFTLLEVAIATTVSAIMVVSLLSYVQFGTDLWRRGEKTIVLTNGARSVSDSMARDFALTFNVRIPTLNNTLGSISFDVPMSTGTYIGTGTICYERDAATRILWRKWIDYSQGVGNIVASISDEGNNAKIYKGRHQYIVARDVATFSVTRISSWSAAVRVGLESIDFGGDADDTAVYEATTTYIFPGVPNG